MTMAGSEQTDGEWTGIREKARRIIFRSTSPGEKLFDVLLITAIVVSVVVVMLESVESIRLKYGALMDILEWVFTGLFTLEYAVRLYVSKRETRYARSFFGIIDLLSILPSYLDLFIPGAQYLMSLRVLRVLRIFRVLKMVQYVGEANTLARAVRASSRKIIVFILAVIILVSVLGSVMYLVEGPAHGFTSIPKSVYWAIVTLTTVGYGDISPMTAPGQMIASAIMIVGYGIIAVPTGIVTAELTLATKAQMDEHACLSCGARGHDNSARFCNRCGAELER